MASLAKRAYQVPPDEPGGACHDDGHDTPSGLAAKGGQVSLP
jgi:hypothetical protein